MAKWINVGDFINRVEINDHIMWFENVREIDYFLLTNIVDICVHLRKVVINFCLLFSKTARKLETTATQLHSNKAFQYIHINFILSLTLLFFPSSISLSTFYLPWNFIYILIPTFIFSHEFYFISQNIYFTILNYIFLSFQFTWNLLFPLYEPKRKQKHNQVLIILENTEILQYF